MQHLLALPRYMLNDALILGEVKILGKLSSHDIT